MKLRLTIASDKVSCCWKSWAGFVFKTFYMVGGVAVAVQAASPNLSLGPWCIYFADFSKKIHSIFEKVY